MTKYILTMVALVVCAADSQAGPLRNLYNRVTGRDTVVVESRSRMVVRGFYNPPPAVWVPSTIPMKMPAVPGGCATSKCPTVMPPSPKVPPVVVPLPKVEVVPPKPAISFRDGSFNPSHTCPSCKTQQFVVARFNTDGTHTHTCPKCGTSWKH